MIEAQNTQIIQEAFAAFLRRDIQSVLDTLDGSVVWKGVTGAGPQVPMSGVRHGKAQVADFFKSVAETVTFSRFEPREFVAQGDTVVALGHYSASVARGGSFDSDFVMVFKLKKGMVIEFQEFLDSAALNAAFEGAGVA